MSVSALFQRPEDAPDAEAALVWAKSYGDDSQKAIRECPRGDWLIWMLTRFKVAPSILVEIAYQYAWKPTSDVFWDEQQLVSRSLSIVQQWIDGEATSDDLNDGFDNLSTDEPANEIDEEYQVPLVEEMICYLLNACIGIDEG